MFFNRGGINATACSEQGSFTIESYVLQLVPFLAWKGFNKKPGYISGYKALILSKVPQVTETATYFKDLSKQNYFFKDRKDFFCLCTLAIKNRAHKSMEKCFAFVFWKPWSHPIVFDIYTKVQSTLSRFEALKG